MSIIAQGLETEMLSYKSMLQAFAFTLCKNREETDDLIQETFYKALVNSDKFTEGTNVRAWLFTIMHNIFVNGYRRKQKFNEVRQRALDSPILLNPAKVAHNGGESYFLNDYLGQALSSVSKDFSEPFMLHYKGYQYQEIADKLDIPLGTVKSRIFFARKEMQQKLREMGITNSAAN